MSYDPSHRMPPSQERWPAATPAEGWPSYRDGEQDDFGYAAQGATAGYRNQTQGAVATAAYPAVANGYAGYAADDFDGRDGYGQGGYGYARGSVGYAEPQGGYAEPPISMEVRVAGGAWLDASRVRGSPSIQTLSDPTSFGASAPLELRLLNGQP